MERPELASAVRAEVRTYLGALAARYLPILAIVVTVVLLLVLVPDTHSDSTAGQRDFAGGSTGALSQSQGSTTGTGGGPVASSGSGGLGTPGGSGSSPLTGQTGSSTGGGRTSTATAGGSASGSAGTGATTGSGGTGIARNGTPCTSGARQFTFTPYAPFCTPKFTGNNGGGTAHGVTATTITVAIRHVADYDQISTAVGEPSIAQYTHDTTKLADYFNMQYELYGRHVIVKQYEGQGSYGAELGGQGQEGANADAQKMYDLGAFADGFQEVGTFADALAARKLVHYTAGGGLKGYQSSYPYRYQTQGPVGEVAAQADADLFCQRMFKMPAVFGGDAVTQKTTRTFAAVEPDSPAYSGAGTVLVSRAKQQCGLTVERVRYTVDISSYPSQSAQVAARLKSDHITTIAMLTDPIFGSFLTKAAVQQQYYPEYLVGGANNNTLPRQWDPKAMQSLIAVYPYHPQNYPHTQSDCYRIYKKADPTGSPQTGLQLEKICAQLLTFFGALQGAGPDLTQAHFGRAWFQQPASNGAGQYGKWSYAGPTMFSPTATFTLQTWRASGTNPYDGGTGVWTACQEPADLPFLNPRLRAGQLHCFGR